ncbi:hypothetical protein AMJ71_00265 [candidate division TA06 bacterium SM1_40]|uniref:Glycosyltransferase 2-like domain-containing protein n=1 Tax=candidate division TA06 bacterium SM1_40 TaxID=1703773 RepID=A0A0S8JPH0_UNCT6|nr:MAG: hypothetical protein AMJ71_00265 [candidate division TA06 bacterium SM1_40]
MDRPELSVIVPTRTRSAVLRRCLKALLGQEPESLAYEVIVVDDGSTDDTCGAVHEAATGTDRAILYVRQETRGPAAARNRGLEYARGRVVLFTGDDIIASERMLSTHMSTHRSMPDENVAVLGHVTWAPEITVTPFMAWLESGGPQFKYWAIEDQEDVPYQHFYTSNISLNKDFLDRYGSFDEDFPFASYEDIELGRRLVQQGLRIVYRREAVGYHWHPTSLDEAIDRMRRVGASYVMYCRKTDDWPRVKRGGGLLRWRRMASRYRYGLSYRLGSALETKMVAGGVYQYLMRRAMEEGMKDVIQAGDPISAQP